MLPDEDKNSKWWKIYIWYIFLELKRSTTLVTKLEAGWSEDDYYHFLNQDGRHQLDGWNIMSRTQELIFVHKQLRKP